MKGYFKRYVAMILAVCITLYSAPMVQAVEPASGFVDMPGQTHWAYEALNSAVQNGILRGENQHLYPAQDLTRAEMAAIINRVFGAEEQADITRFTDVQTSDWFYADQGEGIPEDCRSAIFEPFFRVDKSRSRAVGGSGLGLAVCKKILERHHAQISVLPNQPNGSIFEITFRS